jgi:predicted secreted hydrolase
VTLPADDSLHPSAEIEWLYWTGHLQAPDGRRFGFQEVFFDVGTMSMAHAAVTDVDAGSFHFVESVSPTKLQRVATGFDLSLAGQTARGGGGADTLHAEAPGYVLDLTLSASKPAVLQYGDGYTDYVFGGYTYYYSRERMAAVGTLVVGTEVLPVTGTAWFDHQWGSLATAGQLGWHWFALQLDDGRELMVFLIYGADGRVAQTTGSYTDGASTRQLSPGEIQVTATGTWKSPHTGCVYPSGWSLGVAGMSFTVTPVLLDQELVGPPSSYWEGEALVTGSGTGRAYVELTKCL